MDNIRIFRERNSLSQQTLAEKVGVSQQAVAKWETGKSYPRGETLKKLASTERGRQPGKPQKKVATKLYNINLSTIKRKSIRSSSTRTNTYNI